MIDIGKQIEHWRTGAVEDWEVAQELQAAGKIRHGLFFAHLAVEKLLKALVCRATDDLAPPTHNLVRLAAMTNLALTREQINLLAEVNSFNIAGRYPDTALLLPSPGEAAEYMLGIGGLLSWLTRQL
jgi:HEPN domain-containing protein